MSSKDILIKLFDVKNRWNEAQLHDHKLYLKEYNGIKKIYFTRLTCINNQKYEWITFRFAEQNSNGKSRYAKLIREGAYKSSEICWLYYRYPHYDSKINWLGVIGRDILEITGNFNCNDKHIWFINH